MSLEASFEAVAEPGAAERHRALRKLLFGAAPATDAEAMASATAAAAEAAASAASAEAAAELPRKAYVAGLHARFLLADFLAHAERAIDDLAQHNGAMLRQLRRAATYVSPQLSPSQSPADHLAALCVINDFADALCKSAREALAQREARAKEEEKRRQREAIRARRNSSVSLDRPPGFAHDSARDSTRDEPPPPPPPPQQSPPPPLSARDERVSCASAGEAAAPGKGAAPQLAAASADASAESSPDAVASSDDASFSSSAAAEAASAGSAASAEPARRGGDGDAWGQQPLPWVGDGLMRRLSSGGASDSPRRGSGASVDGSPARTYDQDGDYF